MGANFVAVRLIAASPQHTRMIARRMIALRLAAAIAVSSCTIASALHGSDRSLSTVLLAYSFLFLFYPVQPDFIAVGLGRARVYSISRWIGAASFLGGVLILRIIPLRAWMIPVVYAFSLLVSAIYGYIALWPALHHSGKKSQFGYRLLFRGAMVIVAAQFLQMGQSSINVLLLGISKIPVTLIGEYSAIARLTQAGVLPFIALIYSLAPMYVKQFADRDIVKIKALERRFRMCLLAVGIVGAITIVAIGPHILEVVSGHKMGSVHQLAPLFAIGYLLVALHNSYTAALVYAGATHFYLIVYALGFVGTVLSAMVLIPKFGTLGSGWSQVTGLAIILITSYLFHGRLLRQQQEGCDVSLPAPVAS
jgi:O-antigen/teichoic acid export membrane protein